MAELLRVERGEECAVAVFDNPSLARDAVLALEAAGFPRERISLIAGGVPPAPSVTSAPSVATATPAQEPLQYGDETANNAAKGAGIGGLVGLLVGGAALTVTGLGPIFAAGYLATTLTGAIAGAVLGAMSGWGVHEDHIAEYEELVRQGKTLVMFHGDPRQTAAAEREFQRCRAKEVRVHAAAADEGPEVDDRPLYPR